MAQGGGQSQQAGSAGPGWQRGLEASWVWRERDGDGVAMGEVLRLELLLLNTETIISVMLLFDLKQSAWWTTDGKES